MPPHASLSSVDCGDVSRETSAPRVVRPTGERIPTAEARMQTIVAVAANDTTPAPERPGEVITSCLCGRAYTRSEWGQLAYVGPLELGDDLYEQRNCAGCLSTRALYVGRVGK